MRANPSYSVKVEMPNLSREDWIILRLAIHIARMPQAPIEASLETTLAVNDLDSRYGWVAISNAIAILDRERNRKEKRRG